MARAGSRALSIFTNALNARVLQAHLAGPLTPGELERALGWAPQSSLRAVVRKMCELDALRRAGEDSVGVPSELTPAGRELLAVAEALERWLEQAPGGPVPLDDPAAQGTIRVLAAGWDSTVIRALAEQPKTLLELSGGISGLNYPALKRRLSKLRATGLAAPATSGSGGAYVATDWLRGAIVPLTYAGRWERRHDREAVPISGVEIEAAFLMALPLAGLPARLGGTCALAVLTAGKSARRGRGVAGVTLEIERGEIVSVDTGTPADRRTTWALGTIDAWFEAMIDGGLDALRIGGAKPRLAGGIVKALHADVFSFDPV